MNVLLLAPHPFFQERGTPIAVRMLLEALSREGHSVDVATFSEGADVVYPNVRIHRIPRVIGLRGIRPGFSFKKLVSDFFLFFLALWLVIRRRPHVVHAVEESVFMACVLRCVFRIPYIYDMDSSLPDQIVEKSPRMRWFSPLMHRLVGSVAGAALLVVPVCEALEETAETYRVRKTVVLRDVSLLTRGQAGRLQLRERLHVRGNCFMYVGNLESYQGIDLLLAAFAQHVARRPLDSLVIAGGPASLVEHYRRQCAAAGLLPSVHFLGPQPLELMASLFDEADVLVSPRIQGTNTPMKIYSYLDSGKPILATRLPTHTQAMSDDTALLTACTPEAMAEGMTVLSDDPAVRQRLAGHAQALVKARYSPEAFSRTVSALYGYVADSLKSPLAHEPKPG